MYQLQVSGHKYNQANFDQSSLIFDRYLSEKELSRVKLKMIGFMLKVTIEATNENTSHFHDDLPICIPFRS